MKRYTRASDKMLYLFFDTETTGLPKSFSGSMKEGVWPDVVSIAWIVAEETGKVISTEYYIVKPDGWTIPPESTAIHGITQQTAMEHGQSLGNVIERFLADVEKADVLIAHNISFDVNVVNNALLWRIYSARLLEDFGKRFFCTMKHSTKLCGLPGKRTNTIKAPKLSELYVHLFGKEPSEVLHNALGDTQVLFKCFFAMWKTGLPVEAVKEPKNEKVPSPVITKLVLSLTDPTPDV